MTDTLRKFLFEVEPEEPAKSGSLSHSHSHSHDKSPVRGEIVCLHQTWKQIQDRHRYPAPVLRLLGEMAAASTLLSANLKFNGALIMQIHGDGPVQLLVVECNADLSLRATAKLRDGISIEDDASLASLVNEHGLGRFVITLDPKERNKGQQPYQSVVPLEGDSIAAVLESYMLRSEQLDTHLWLAADTERANGLLLQRLPTDDGTAESKHIERDAETWNRAILLGNTIEREELLAIDSDTLMRRLFWEETLRVFEPLPCRFECSCSRERVAKMLVTLGQQEVEDTLAELGRIDVHCEFCNKAYHFDAVDCTQLFATSNTIDGVRPPQGLRH